MNPQLSPYPTTIFLEVTNYCNLRCLRCAMHGKDAVMRRPVGHMPRSIWEAIIREIGEWQTPVSVITHGAGEPLLHPEILDILRFCKSFTNIQVGFLTNGMLLTADVSEALINLGIDWVGMSIDGIDPVWHRKLRYPSDLNQITNNLENFLKIRQARKNTPRVLLNMVLHPEIIDQGPKFVKRWIDRVETVMLAYCRIPPSSKRWPNTPNPRQACHLPYQQMVIGQDGRLLMCCEDFDCQHSPGRVPEQKLLDIWQGSFLDKVRKYHQAGKWGAVPLCRTCDSWAEGLDPVMEEDKVRGIRKTVRVSQTIYEKI